MPESHAYAQCRSICSFLSLVCLPAWCLGSCHRSFVSCNIGFTKAFVFSQFKLLGYGESY